jgi:ribose transport system permease protein
VVDVEKVLDDAGVTNPRVREYVAYWAELTGVARVEVVTAADDDRLIQEALDAGELLPAGEGRYYSRSYHKDTARPDAPIVKAIGQAKWPLHEPAGWAPHWIPELSSHFWVMVALALVLGFVINFTAWARHLFAIGANENAARLTGVPVDWIKFQAYVFSAFTASIASLLLLGYSGSAINAMGTGYELRVIAGTVIGGANLMGGYGTAFGAVVGSAFLEVIRNALLMAGIDSNWQGFFVGMFIVLAVLLGMQTSGRSLVTTFRELFALRRS